MQTERGLFLDIPVKHGRQGTTLVNAALGAQFVINVGLGVSMFAMTSRVRDVLADRATSKCERLSGCGLTEILFQFLGGLLLCGAYLAYCGILSRETETKNMIARMFLLQHLLTVLVLVKEQDSGVYGPAVFTVMLPLLCCASLVYCVLVAAPRKEPRSPAVRRYAQ